MSKTAVSKTLRSGYVPEALQRLWWETHGATIATGLLACGNLDPDIDDAISRINSATIRAAWIAVPTRTSWELEQHATNETRIRVLEEIAEHRNCNTTTAQHILDCVTSEKVLRTIARNTKLPIGIRMKGLYEVQRAVANNRGANSTWDRNILLGNFMQEPGGVLAYLTTIADDERQTNQILQFSEGFGSDFFASLATWANWVQDIDEIEALIEFAGSLEPGLIQTQQQVDEVLCTLRCVSAELATKRRLVAKNKKELYPLSYVVHVAKTVKISDKLKKELHKETAKTMRENPLVLAQLKVALAQKGHNTPQGWEAVVDRGYDGMKDLDTAEKPFAGDEIFSYN